MTAPPTIIEFVTGMLGLSLSPAQRTLLKSTYGLPLDAQELEIFRQCTGRQTYSGHPFPEVTVIAGARAGKDSRIAAPVACFEALFGGHERQLGRGERAIIPCVAQDARAARIAFDYIRDYLRTPLLRDRIDVEMSTEIALTNRVSVAVFPCTMRSLRGYSIPVGVMDEIGYFRLEGSANSDEEVQASIRRGMVNFAGTRLVKISTPYMKGGVLYDDFKRAFGQDDPDLLVWRASSLLMNPSLATETLDRERRQDPKRYAREYEAEFAEDISAFLPSAWVDAAVRPGRHELPPLDKVPYVAAVDASGGGADAFTLAVVHAEGDGPGKTIVQDVMRSWTKPRDGATDLEGAVQEIAAIVKRYRLSKVVGDRYSAGWVRESFKRCGITYEEPAIRDVNGASVYCDRSRAYVEIEPAFAMCSIEILDHPRLVRELKLLERRPRAGGKDLVDHPRGQHDDHANALALAAAVARQGRPELQIYLHGPSAPAGKRVMTDQDFHWTQWDGRFPVRRLFHEQ
jgi:hypothetical protein